MNIEKTKIKQLLKKRLGRNPKENEITNSMSETSLILEIVLEEVDKIKERLAKLEK